MSAAIVPFPRSRRVYQGPAGWCPSDHLLISAFVDLGIARRKKRASLVLELVTDARDCLDRFIAEQQPEVAPPR